MVEDLAAYKIEMADWFFKLFRWLAHLKTIKYKQKAGRLICFLFLY
jgi:hypothetical protein